MEEGLEVQVDDALSCSCGELITPNARFCKACGAPQEADDLEEAVNHQRGIVQLAVFFGLLLLICLLSRLDVFSDGLAPLLVFDSCFVIIVLVYAYVYRLQIKSLFRWPDFSIIKTVLYSAAAIAASMLVQVIVKWLNRTMFDVEYNYYEAFSHLRYAKIATILSIALHPAIFEEIAFRGIMQHRLKMLMEEKQAIFITAFLFSLIHISLVSFFWLFPFSIALGYICAREKTLWYGILIHFFFNATACFFEFFELNLF